VNSWKVILATVVIFAAGVITGGLLVNHVNDTRPDTVDPSASVSSAHVPADNHTPTRPLEVPLPRLAERLSKEFVRRLDKTLHLTMVQSNAIAAIVAEGQERNHVIWTNVAPQMRKVMQDVNQQIRAELTPEQLMQFEELMKPHPPKRPPATNAPPSVTTPTNSAPPV